MITLSNSEFMDNLFSALKDLRGEMRCTNAAYAVFKKLLIDYFRSSELAKKDNKIYFGPFGVIEFPYIKMGSIDSIDLFGIDELMIFAYYLANRHRYRKTLDIGANIGLHSILMARCGFHVTSFEPDPLHQDLFIRNMERNNIANVVLEKTAISDKEGEMEFTRVLGNTTGSHLIGAKVDPYGDLERFNVNVKTIEPYLKDVNFAKIDVEGHEVVVLKSIPKQFWEQLDVMVEIGSSSNAQGIFDYLSDLEIKCYSQKIGWQRVKSLSDFPTSHKEGSLLISNSSHMPWS